MGSDIEQISVTRTTSLEQRHRNNVTRTTSPELCHKKNATGTMSQEKCHRNNTTGVSFRQFQANSGSNILHVSLFIILRKITKYYATNKRVSLHRVL